VKLPQFPPSLTPLDVARGANGRFLLNSKSAWEGRSPPPPQHPNCEIPGGDRKAINRQSALGGGGGRGRGGGEGGVGEGGGYET
jgi:hypothetical protein